MAKLTDEQIDKMVEKSVLADLSIAGFLAFCEQNKISKDSVLQYTRGFISAITREQFSELKARYVEQFKTEDVSKK